MSVRNLALTVHVTTSVGWFGSVLAFLALAIAGVAGNDPIRVRGAYLAMDVLGWYVIVPLCVASFASGIVQSLVTKWGLFRHYWVVIKLVLTVLASAFLILHTRVISHMADAAADGELGGEHAGMQAQLVFDASAALVVLVVTTVLAVFKPKGQIARSRPRQEPRGETRKDF